MEVGVYYVFFGRVFELEHCCLVEYQWGLFDALFIHFV